MEPQLENRVVLVTGGAKGIGAAIVRAAAAESAIPLKVISLSGRKHRHKGMERTIVSG